MLSCHREPFSAFVRDLQIPFCEVHLYRGPNAFGCTLESLTPAPTAAIAISGNLPTWWDGEDVQNVYFLAGVRPGLTKRAADSDVLCRGMFTLDFDIRKELEKNPNNYEFMPEMIERYSNLITAVLMSHPLWQHFRYIVMSGNGMHVHYFGQPTEVVKELWVAGMKSIFEEINALPGMPLPCDMGCGNAGRIMRMPGSWNVKDPANKRPVVIDGWQEGESIGRLEFVQQRGKMHIEHMEERKAVERAAFAEEHPAGGSDVIDIINEIPVEQVVQQLLGCTVKNVKKDGGMRFVDDKGIERGFFRHQRFNVIVHEGTSLFPPPGSGTGYNCLSLAKEILRCDAAGAIRWFAERSARVRAARDAENKRWREETQSHDISFHDTIIKPHGN